MNSYPDSAFMCPMPLRWGDQDAYQHVNNATFVRLLEEARVRAIREWFGKDGLMGGVMVARNEIEYLAPLDYRLDPITIAVWVSQLRGASFELSYEVIDAPTREARLYARATVVMVAYDFTSAAPRRLSADERAAMTAVSGPTVPMRRGGSS